MGASSLIRGVSAVRLAILVLVVGLTSWFALPTSRSDEPLATPQDLVAQLQRAVAAGSTQEIEQVTSALTKLGDAALPAIEEGLAKGDNTLSGRLLRVLGGIPGDGSTSLLVQVVGGGDADLRLAALGRLDNRPIRRELSADELRALIGLVAEAPVGTAGSAARVLAKCERVQVETRLTPTLSRFGREVTDPSPFESAWPSYVSPRVYALNQFLLAFSYIGEPAASALSQQRQQATDHELRKWLALALGMAGDATVSGELEQVVRGDPDRYVRCVAVRAYARAAGPDAVPLLRSLLADETQSEYRGCVVGEPVFLIRQTAKDELFRLEQAAKSQP